MARQRILIADDNEINRLLIREMLIEDYEILEAENGEEAVSAIQDRHGDIDLLLLDLVMPVMDGTEVLKVMNRRGWIKDIPVIIISSETAPTYTRIAYELGVEDFINRPFDPYTVHHRIENVIALHANQKRLMDDVLEQFYARERQNNMMISVLSHIVEYQNGESGTHVWNINAISGMLLDALTKKTDRYELPANDIEVIRSASSFHDIGKIGIPDAILNKPGRLTPEEFEVMKTHSAIGAGMLDNMSAFQDEPMVKYAREICRWHHERWDGRGYPDGLKGDEIPITTQIVSLADVYDALTSDRCYKKAYSHETALNMILNGECGVFNPLLLDCLRDIAPRLKSELLKADTDGVMPEAFAGPSMLAGPELKSSVDVSRNIRLLREEEARNDVFLRYSSEYWAELFFDPSKLSLNPAAAEHFGLPEQIQNPLNSSRLAECFGRDTLDAIAGSVKEKEALGDFEYLSADSGLRFVGRFMWNDNAEGQRILSCVLTRISVPEASDIKGDELK